MQFEHSQRPGVSEDLSEIINNLISRAPTFESNAIEAANARTGKLTDIVCEMVDLLNRQNQIDLLKRISHSNWAPLS